MIKESEKRLRTTISKMLGISPKQPEQVLHPQENPSEIANGVRNILLRATTTLKKEEKVAPICSTKHINNPPAISGLDENKGLIVANVPLSPSDKLKPEIADKQPPNINKCLDYQELLPEYIDGDLKPNKCITISDHLENCQVCNSVYKDLKQIVEISRKLPLVVPKNFAWAKIEKEISELTLKQSPKKYSIWSKFWNYKLQLNISIPELTAGLAVLVILLILIDSFSYSPQLGSQSTVVARPATALTEIELINSIEKYSRTIGERYAQWDPQLQKLFDHNLAIVNKSIDECQQLLQRNPKDPVAHEMLICAYQEKVRLLEQFISLR